MRKFLTVLLLTLAPASAWAQVAPSDYIKPADERCALIVAKAMVDVDGLITLPAKCPNVAVWVGPLENANGGFDEENNVIALSDESQRNTEQVLIHEIGHYLDSRVLIKGVSDKDGIDNYSASGCTGNPDYVAFWKAVNASDQRHALRKLMASCVDAGAYGQASYLMYLMSPAETFARAFEEYVCTRGSDPDLKKAAEAEYNSDDIMLGQWTDKDFAPIDKALDALFVAKHIKRMK